MYWLFCDINDTLAFQSENVDWHTDWWKVLIIAFAALLFLALLLRLALYVLRLLGVAVCVAVGSAGAWVAKGLFTEQLAQSLPPSAEPYAPVACALAGFLLCFGIAAFIMKCIRKTARPVPQAPPEK
ncbi:MAG: hypothetical protein J6Y80_01860 [Victivallales bacterium]|nr:hypothetical protein [Victivallales bacterium]